MLNPQQEIAIKQISKPVYIVAGPGTGKTTVISEKISYLISKGFDPDNILALSFTQKAAEELSQRVSEKTGKSFSAKTFHSFCLELIDEFNLLSLEDFPTVLDEAYQQIYFLDNISEFNFSSIKVLGKEREIATEIQRTISQIKDFGYTLRNIHSMNFSNSDEKADILSAFSKYELYKKKNNLIDYGDILNLVLDKLQTDEEFKKKVIDKYSYILVDEFQDSNKVQLDIISHVSTKDNFTGVGDNKQSIYGFRGANYNNFNLLKEMFSNLEIIYLTENYRSSDKILTCINDLVLKLSSTQERLKSNNKNSQDEVKLYELENEFSQLDYLFENVSKILSEFPDKKIGILTRRHIEIKKIKKYFKERGLKIPSSENDNLFQNKFVEFIESVLKIIEDPKDSHSKLFFLLDNLPIKKETLRRIVRQSYLNEKSLYVSFTSIDKLSDYESERLILSDFKERLVSLVEKKNNFLSLRSLILDIIKQFNLYQKAFVSDEKENVFALNSFLKFTENYLKIYKNQSITFFLKICSLSKKVSLPVEEPDIDQSIELLTIHQSKGKEFDIVFLPYLNERRFPSQYKSPYFKTEISITRENYLDEEERVFFVAMSRAKEKLYLSYVKRYDANKLNSKPSPFLSYLDLKTLKVESKGFNPINKSDKEIFKLNQIKKITELLYSENFALAKQELSLLHSKLASKKDLNHFFTNNNDRLNENEFTQMDEIEVSNLTFSASKLSTYLACPKKFKYQYVYGVPSVAKHYFDFGTSVHQVLEFLVKKEDWDQSNEMLFTKGCKYLTNSWISKGYETHEQEREYYELALEIIKNFISKQRELKFDTVLDLEKRFSITVNGKSIKGVIDRIDKIDSEQIQILDYKTSKSMDSEKDLQENIQLYIYSLASKQIYGEYPKYLSLWYVLHDKIKTIEFDPNKLEQVELKISQAISDINLKNFKPKPSFFNCKFCDFNSICEQSMFKDE